ncbi:hypothetical protein A0H81_14072 [Grifola frondosa]|uniref:Uncharacterized protein n=1 Tax=Grifola frondosa TaxID=5627 RepID=A0A1C7LPG0_GRIFR|nr:hypothetical protein A0H81_14072 [Grifola frondosa]
MPWHHAVDSGSILVRIGEAENLANSPRFLRASSLYANDFGTNTQPPNNLRSRTEKIANVESLQGFSHSAYFSCEIRLSAVPIQAVATILPRELSSIPSQLRRKGGDSSTVCCSFDNDLRRLVAIVVSQAQP